MFYKVRIDMKRHGDLRYQYIHLPHKKIHAGDKPHYQQATDAWNEHIYNLEAQRKKNKAARRASLSHFPKL